MSSAPPERAPTPASALAARFKVDTITLSTGITVRARKISLMREVLGGSLPNVVLNWVVFGSGDDAITGYAQRTAEMHKARLYVVARILVEPRLHLGRDDIRNVEPDYAAGEIGPNDLTHQEVWELYHWGLVDVLPEVDTAPFPAHGDAAGTAGTAAPARDDVPAGAA